MAETELDFRNLIAERTHHFFGCKCVFTGVDRWLAPGATLLRHHRITRHGLATAEPAAQVKLAQLCAHHWNQRPRGVVVRNFQEYLHDS